MRNALLLGWLVLIVGCVADVGYEPAAEGGPPGAGDGDGDADGDDGRAPTGCAACAEGDLCIRETCVTPLGDCDGNGDCLEDSYCTEGACIPYGAPEGHDNDDTCTRMPEPGPFVPELQCAWSTPPADDPTPSHFQVMATPVVADLGFVVADDPENPEVHPSIVFSTFEGSAYSSNGVLRIVDGETCALQQSLNVDPADRTIGASPATIADLDGDGRAEVVAPASGGGLLAFGWDEASGALARRWRSRNCDTGVSDTTGPGNWAGASAHDLDDDGIPEIVFGAVVYDAEGCILDSAKGFRAHSAGQVPVLADVDGDGEIEWIAGNELLRFDVATRSLQVEEGFVGAGRSNGFVAVADFGEFPGTASEAPGIAEIAVVSGGTARIQTIAGEVVFGPFSRAGLATGGPPTIGDFDGDGTPELASAGGDRYVVFDLECDADPVPDGCEARGIRWSQPSQDHSSNVTGSSVFDFEGDGAADAVYADECFLRVYDGATGVVKFSQARSSGTTYENPVVADVDGDFNSEIVTCTNDYAGTLGCAAEDPLFAGATFEVSHGIRVFADAEDRWVGSRPVWNQHAYAVTGVGDRGEIPATSDWSANWTTPGLNNFRQNVQGTLVPNAAPDLTARGEGFEVTSCEGEDIRFLLRATVCNRGTEPVAEGVAIRFEDLPAAEGAAALCETATTRDLAPGHCEQVSCEAAVAVPDPRDVRIEADAHGANVECLEANNLGTLEDVGCDILL